MSSRRTLPDPILRVLAAQPSAGVSETGILLIVNGDGGVPRVAAVGPGEIRAIGPDVVNLCLHRGSRTSRQLTRIGRGLLMLAHSGELIKLDLATEVVEGEADVSGVALTVFRGLIQEVSVDSVDYATDVSVLRYRLRDPEPVIRRWRAQWELLGRY